MATITKSAVPAAGPLSAEENAKRGTDERAAARAAFAASIPREGGASDPGAKEDDGSIPAGGGSTPMPNDPANDPLEHLQDLPGVSESPPTEGAGLPDTPPPSPPPPPAPPPPTAQASKG